MTSPKSSERTVPNVHRQHHKVRTDSKIFHAKTFQIERLNCVVKFATKVRKTAFSIPIPMKEIIWIHLFEICIYNLKPFSYHSDTFRSSGYSSDHTDTLQIVWTLFESSGFAKTFRSALLTLWLWASNVKFSSIKSGLNTLSIYAV